MANLIDFDSITEETLREVGGLKWRRPGVLGAWVAEMDFGIAPVIRNAVVESVSRGATGYATPTMIRDMQDAYVGWAGEHYGWEVSPEQVRPLPDVISALIFMLDHLIPNGSTVVLPTPAYMPFLTLPQLHGHEVVQVPMVRDDDSWAFDLDALSVALADRAGLLVLCNPHNPIGRVLEPGELARVAELADRHGVRVFSDEIHAPIVYPGHAHVPFASISETAAALAVTATSASKAWNIPGLKAAQLVLTNESDREVWARVGANTEHGASNPGLVANAAAYREGEPWLREVLDYVGETRGWFAAQVAERIPGARADIPEGTYLSLVDLRGVEGCDRWGDRPGAFLRERAGVELTDGPLCGAAGNGMVRFNLATTRPIISEALDRMAAALCP
ncbi:MAG: aminotransferase class I/II-fold pyridoxal phosphate-dependent enzyme [bacterium]|nr:aminotransferase class I/II-fold pyridoxal phosphate-dependent enzyme [bacterium]